MKILVLGAGAVGSLLAFRLGAGGHHVTAVGRTSFVEAVAQRGLLVEEDGRPSRAVQLEAVEGVEALADARFDLVLITTKVFDSTAAALQVRPFARRGAPVLVVQNGVGGIKLAGDVLGERDLYAGALTIPVQVLGPASIRLRSGKGGVGLAPVTPSQDAGPLVQAFTQAGVRARSYAHWRAMRWSKLMLNLLANAVPAILDQPVDQVYADRGLYDLERDALREAWTVARRLGLGLVPLPGYPVPLLVWLLCALGSRVTHPIFCRVVVGGRAGKLPSLHIDLRRGRHRSEVEFLNGAVVRAGVKVGVSTPINCALYETLIQIVRGQVDWSAYRGQAERLIRRARNKG